MKNLLMVDTDRHTRDVFAAVVRGSDDTWNVDFAETAEEALEQCTNRPFDIVLASNRLNRAGEGLALLETLKDRQPETIRFLLIEESDQDLTKALIGAPQQVLIKPLDLPSFVKQAKRAFLLRSVIQNPSTLRLLGKAESLPPLPRVFQAVAQKLNDFNAPLHEVASIISEDIVLSSKVLKLANSALFSLRSPATTVGHAVSLLGSRAISSLVFSQGVGDMFTGGAASEMFIEELNRHSLECAALASNILYSWNAEKQLAEKALFCGIAHDIGKLVLAKYAPNHWNQIVEEMKTKGISDLEAERAVVGISHSEIAAYLLAIWGFPNDQLLAIAFHHEPSKISDHEFGLLCALHLAENLVHTELHGRNFDWDYLAECRLTPDDVAALGTMLDRSKTGK